MAEFDRIVRSVDTGEVLYGGVGIGHEKEREKAKKVGRSYSGQSFLKYKRTKMALVMRVDGEVEQGSA